jgi:hypothetical protein
MRARLSFVKKFSLLQTAEHLSSGSLTPQKELLLDCSDEEIVNLHFTKESIRKLLLTNTSLRSASCLANSNEIRNIFTEYLNHGNSIDFGLSLLSILRREHAILSKLVHSSNLKAIHEFQDILRETDSDSISSNIKMGTGHWKDKLNSSPSPFKMHLNNFQKWKQVSENGPANELIADHSPGTGNNYLTIPSSDVDISFDQVYLTPEPETVINNKYRYRDTV